MKKKEIKSVILLIKESIFRLQCVDGYENDHDLLNAYDKICDFEKINNLKQ